MNKNTPIIDIKKARTILQPGGPLSLFHKGYEFREQQQKMLEDVIHAYQNNQIALIEAGTGIGKSMAYLVPAILWSAQTKERTLISTNTIALQEQLLKKDIPLASKIVGYPVNAVLIKGMSNYLCLRRLEDTKQERVFLTDKEKQELDLIESWSEQTNEGSLSNLPIVPSSTTWERVCAERDTCTYRRCPYYKKCPFFNARTLAEEAQLLVVNHSILFADLSYRELNKENEETGLLPIYTRVIVDEAHHIERVATEFFAAKVSYIPLLRWLSKLGAEKQGKLTLLHQKILLNYLKVIPPEASAVHSRLSIDIAGIRRELLQNITDLFHSFILFLQKELEIDEKSFEGDAKLRILPKHTNSPTWTSEIIPLAQNLSDSFKNYLHTVRAILKEVLELNHAKLQEETETLRHEILAFCNRLEMMSQSLDSMINAGHQKEKVMWIEAKTFRSMTNAHLVNAELDISQKLAGGLFKKFPTTVLCSATLTTNGNFHFIKDRLGLNSDKLHGKQLQERIYYSPFDYSNQVQLLITTDMPSPLNPNFSNAASEKIWLSIQACRGNAFILFTSYGMMKKCFNILADRLIENKFVVFKQGDANRHLLLEQYRKSERGVLFGTDSFWEGVDVAGDSLRCVIIVKLPFKVPSEPIIQARTEAIAIKGGDPFHDYTVPTAIVKFKQGFGRLIRNKKDKGVIVCLDSRILHKNYGALFLNSLPECPKIYLKNNQELTECVENFFRKHPVQKAFFSRTRKRL